ncbi:MAG: hypothetical protein HY647_04570, partial [Acidobacteria bacterium]|nr:hypothetical protein [Acidobacteriota bacterium]
MKRNYTQILLALAVVWCVAMGNAFGQSAAELTRKLDQLKAYPDLIVVNGKISTIDARNSEVQALAVRSNRIIALGTNDEMRLLAGPKTEVLDAKGRRVLPGLIDGHTHPHVWAMEHWVGAEGDFTSKKYNEPQMKMALATGDDQAAVLRALERVVRQRAQELGPGKWILVQLFAKNTIPEARKIVWPMFTQSGGQPGAISQQYLDTLAPNNPLMVFAGEAIGPAANNTKAKEETIRLLGYEVFGLGARSPIVYDILLRGRLDDQVDFLKRELLDCVVAQGVTTFGNHYYGSPSIMKVYRTMYERGEMPVRWGWWEGTLWGNGSPGFS